jgi:hypothetical protein
MPTKTLFFLLSLLFLATPETARAASADCEVSLSSEAVVLEELAQMQANLRQLPYPNSALEDPLARAFARKLEGYLAWREHKPDWRP